MNAVHGEARFGIIIFQIIFSASVFVVARLEFGLLDELAAHGVGRPRLLLLLYLSARKVLGWPKISKLARAFL
jgi:hypothetical protein